VARALYDRVEAEALRRGICDGKAFGVIRILKHPIRIIYIMEYIDVVESRYLAVSYNAGAD
jgi:hypothetical protein